MNVGDKIKIDGVSFVVTRVYAYGFYQVHRPRNRRVKLWFDGSWRYGADGRKVTVEHG